MIRKSVVLVVALLMCMFGLSQVKANPDSNGKRKPPVGRKTLAPPKIKQYKVAGDEVSVVGKNKRSPEECIIDIKQGATVVFKVDDSRICTLISNVVDAENRTTNAIKDLSLALSTKIDGMISSNKTTQELIQQQIKQNNQLLFETLQKRLNSIPTDLLTNPAFKEVLEKLKKDILDEVKKGTNYEK